jgi:hypothetical protein
VWVTGRSRKLTRGLHLCLHDLHERTLLARGVAFLELFCLVVDMYRECVRHRNSIIFQGIGSPGKRFAFFRAVGLFKIP